MEFFAKDLGILVFGKTVLQKTPSANLKITINPTIDDDDFLLNLWKIGLEKIIHEKTKFGRIGLLFDRKNFKAEEFAQNIIKTSKTLNYKPNNRRSEKNLIISAFPISILNEMVCNNLEKSVEFRRLSRKFIRFAKNKNCDSLFILDPILAEKNARKSLESIAGTQLKLFFIDDFFIPPTENSKKRAIKIEFQGKENLDFLHKLSEKLLNTKITKDCLVIKNS